jgi:hypothetical protein
LVQRGLKSEAWDSKIPFPGADSHRWLHFKRCPQVQFPLLIVRSFSGNFEPDPASWPEGVIS